MRQSGGNKRFWGVVVPLSLFALILCIPGSVEGASKKVYTTQRVVSTPPLIDGRLDDSSWNTVDWGDGFIQREPEEGRKTTQKTGFKILYDDQNLYIAVRAHDKEPDKIVRRMSRRDQLEGDWVAVNIDSYHDLSTAFSFMVNAAGVKGDETVFDNGSSMDPGWDPVWYVKTAVDSAGWSAEMRIPLSQLRFANREDHVWGLQLTRRIFRNEESAAWQYIPRDAPGWVHLFGELRGIKGIKPDRQVGLLPYTVARSERFEPEEGNPFLTGQLQGMAVGLDGKVAVTNDLTLDFTINPDFGQVEADPSEVNLTAYETFFPEKRPFFIEGRNIMDFQITGGDGDFSRDNLFYSRRIGRPPQYEPDTREGEYVDMPDNTAILGAFKLTGKTRNGLSIGILDGITVEGNARIDNMGERRYQSVEPLTNYFLFRLQKDYSQGRTKLGGMVTATHRFIKDPQLNFLHRAAYTGGFDFYHSWKKRTYYVSLDTVWSLVRGDEEALLQTQESSVRYFQRPDAAHFNLDPGRTSLFGHGGTLALGKGGSGRLRFSTGLTWRSPGLELNDMGYLRSSDRIMQWAWLGYRILKPFAIFRYVSINLNQWKGWNFGGENIFAGGNINGYSQFKNYWGLGAGTNLQGESLSSTALRGGPSLRYPRGFGYWFNLHTDRRKKLRLEMGGSYFGRYNLDSTSRSVWLGVTYRPSTTLSISVDPFIRFSQGTPQYVCTQEIDPETRYIMGEIDQKTVGITLRLNYSITPNLSIQFYGQPYVSAGSYSRFNYIKEPRARQYAERHQLFDNEQINLDQVENVYQVDENRDGLLDYSFDNPNFDFLQFRSNLVIRWEYTPGSTLYLVWSQGRTDSGSTGHFDFGSDLQDLFTLRPHHVFLAKFTYRFNL